MQGIQLATHVDPLVEHMHLDISAMLLDITTTGTLYVVGFASALIAIMIIKGVSSRALRVAKGIGS